MGACRSYCRSMGNLRAEAAYEIGEHVDGTANYGAYVEHVCMPTEPAVSEATQMTNITCH